MAFSVTVRDESASGEILSELPLEFPTQRITVRELIRERVYQEVQDFNRRQDDTVFRGMVQPTDAERVLNGRRTEYRLKAHRQIDWKDQFDKAIESFGKCGFLVLVDNKQADGLDQAFDIGPGMQISFLKLTLLVGG